MSETTYNDPKLALNRIYTKRGDQGETSLVNGRAVPKDDVKIEAYGTVDELNAFVGAACVTAQELAPSHAALQRLIVILVRVQHELFNLGSVLATDPGEVHPRQPQVGDRDIEQLETEIDEMNASLGKLRSFVLPGGCRLNTDLHLCRTVCRRAERLCVALGRNEQVPSAALRYLNRLSDAFFVWSRWASQQLGEPEVLWDPNRAASGDAGQTPQ
ncbi:MAG: cob(I)yrinic acid a,c-diamide adenosyltransferase [Bryobacterales bacterium]